MRSRKGKLEIVLLTIAWLAFFSTELDRYAGARFPDYALRPVPLLAGTVCLTLGVRLFHVSHEDLGAHWSITLEVLEKHRLVTQGVYRHSGALPRFHAKHSSLFGLGKAN